MGHHSGLISCNLRVTEPTDFLTKKLSHYRKKNCWKEFPEMQSELKNAARLVREQQEKLFRLTEKINEENSGKKFRCK